MPNTNRNKGNSYERTLAQEFRELGFDKCLTSRHASKLRDDECVDLVGTEPFNIQAKCWKSAPSYHKTLASMPDEENYNVIFHKRPRQGEVVVMTKSDFYEIVQMLKSNKVI